MCTSILPNTIQTLIFLTAVKSYYDTCKEISTNNNLNELYIQNYELFLSEFKVYLINNNYYPNIINEDLFKLYSHLFKISYERLINGEKYILDEKEKYTKTPYYLIKLKKYISEVDIYR